MSLLFLCGALLSGTLLSGAVVEVSLAPDQPVPHLYVGEPLIVEIVADEDTTASVQLSIRSFVGDLVESYDSGLLPLRAGERRWCILDSVAEKRGYYTAEIVVDSAGETSTTSTPFCRIDRPVAARLPDYAYSAAPDRASRGALLHAGLNVLRLDGGHPDTASRMAEAVEDGFRVVLTFDTRGGKDFSEAVGHLDDTYCDKILRWEVSVDDAAAAENVFDVLRARRCRTPWAVVVPDVESFQKLLAEGIGAYTREAVLVGSGAGTRAVVSLRRVAAEAGFESWGVSVVDSDYRAEEGRAALRVVPGLLLNMAERVAQTGVDVRHVFDDAVLGVTLPALRGLADRYQGEAYVGDVGGLFDGGAGTLWAPVFRDGGRWFMALWRRGEERPITLDLGEARAVVQTDAFGNREFESAGPIGGPLVVSISEAPTYLRGEGGTLLAMAARQEVVALAKAFVGKDSFGKYLDEAQAVVGRLLGDVSGGGRAAFLDVIRLFPVLERGWDRGAMPRNVVVPALAQLARLSRALCVLEESRGESFLEPLQDTLRRCEEYQSLYLTGSVSLSGVDGRGEWLMAEVRRHMDEAVALAAAGRRIEASALASLAEWRARALEYVHQDISHRDWVVDTIEVRAALDSVAVDN